MRLRFLGTGTSTGTPVVGCQCHVCRSPDPRNHRLRTSALIEVHGQTILLDAGPDFRAQALAANIRTLNAVVLTHSHYDHTSGLDDLRPIIHGRSMPIYCDPTTLRQVRERFSYAFGDASSEGSTRPDLELVPIRGPFTIGGLPFVPFDIQHGTWTITGYRIGDTLGYATDVSGIPPRSMEHLRNLDVLVIGTLRYFPHPTHFTLAQTLDAIAELRPARAFMVHMNHHLDHATVNMFLPPGVALAYDGLTLDIPCVCESE